MNDRAKIKFIPCVRKLRQDDLVLGLIGDAPDVFKGRNGYFFNRHANKTWYQFDDKCYAFGSREHFEETLATCEGPKLNADELKKLRFLVSDGIINRDDKHVMEIIRIELIARNAKSAKLSVLKFLRNGLKKRNCVYEL